MNYMVPMIEQLDRSAELLRDGSSIADRLALILVDNAMEITMHTYCRDRFRMENILVRLGASRYTEKQRTMALGQHFGGKVKFLVQVDKVTRRECDFILTCHSYRNEAYHTGLTHHPNNA